MSEKTTMNENLTNVGTDYGNWVPAAMMKPLWIVIGVLCVLELLNLCFLKSVAVGIVLAAALAAGFDLHFVHAGLPETIRL